MSRKHAILFLFPKTVDNNKAQNVKIRNTPSLTDIRKPKVS